MPEDGLKASDVGLIVFVHRDGEAYEVEFLALDGSTIAITTAYASQGRPVTAKTSATPGGVCLRDT